MSRLGLTKSDWLPLAVLLILVVAILSIWLAPTALPSGEKITSSAILVSAVGVIMTFWQAERGRRKQVRMEFLKQAYQAIEVYYSRDYDACPWYRDHPNAWAIGFENAIRDLQLLGSPKVAALARGCTENETRPEIKQAQLEQLIMRLRNELRDELGEYRLSEAPRSMRHISAGTNVGSPRQS